MSISIHNALIATTTVALGLTLGTATCANNLNTPSSLNHYNGFGVGVITGWNVMPSTDLTNSASYRVAASYKHGPYLFDLALNGFNNLNNGTVFNYWFYSWWLQSLNSQWNLMYGLNYTGTYITNLSRNSASHQPYNVNLALGLAYNFNHHLQLSLATDLLTYGSTLTGIHRTHLISNPILQIRYFFNNNSLERSNVTHPTADPHGFGVGLEQSETKSLDLKSYAITLNYKTGPWLFNFNNNLEHNNIKGTTLTTSAFIWRLHSLSKHWTFQYGIDGGYTYLSNQAKLHAGYTDSAWGTSALTGLAYTYNQHIRLSFFTAIVRFISNTNRMKETDFFTAPNVTITYFFN